MITDFDGIKITTSLEFNKVDTQLEGEESAQDELKGPMVGISINLFLFFF